MSSHGECCCGLRFSFGSQGACAYLAYLRWQEGADMTQFTSGFQPEDFNQMGVPQTDMSGYNVDNNYSTYTAGAEIDPNYQSNPFTAMASQETMAPNMNYQTPSY